LAGVSRAPRLPGNSPKEPLMIAERAAFAGGETTG
jgi:hypothetical protein